VRGGVEYRHPAAWEKEQQRLKDELAAAQKQLADREVKINSNRQGSSAQTGRRNPEGFSGV